MGGGRRAPQTTTVSGGIDKEFKPYLENHHKQLQFLEE